MTPDDVTVITIPTLSEMPRGQLLAYAPKDAEDAKAWGVRHGAKEIYLFQHMHPRPYFTAWLKVGNKS